MKRPNDVSLRIGALTTAMVAALALAGFASGQCEILGSETVSDLNQGVATSGTLVYVAGRAAPGAPGELSVIDVSNPDAPFLRSSVLTGFDFARGVAASGTLVYVVGLDNVPGALTHLSVIDVSDPDAPFVRSDVSLPGKQASEAEVAASGTFAYVITRPDPDEGRLLSVIDASNPDAPFVRGSIIYRHYKNSPPFSLGVSIAVSGTLLYATSPEDDFPDFATFSVIDVSDPDAPVLRGSLDLGSEVAPGVAAAGTLAYVSNGAINTIIRAIDVSDPDFPFLRGFVQHQGPPGDLAISGTHVYVARSLAQQVSVIDVSNPDGIFHRTTIGMPARPRRVVASDTRPLIFVGDDSTLSVISFAGACCLPDGSCVDDVTMDECDAQGGMFQGNGTQCAGQCVFGACCFDDGSCTFALESDCIAAGGIYEGGGVTCADANCPQPGACCIPDGSCEVVTPAQCDAMDGNYGGTGSMCDGPCAACCFGENCASRTEITCIGQGGEYQGDGTACNFNLCPVGACCLANGTCVDDVTTVACDAQGGLYQGDESLCGEVTCTPFGACCMGEVCFDRVDAYTCDILGGHYQGAGTSCDGTPCGACCFGESCAQRTETICVAQGGEFEGSGVPCVFGETCIRGGDYSTDGNALDLTPLDDAYDGTLTSMASLTVNVPDCFTITDIDVILDIAHTWAGDLVVKLQSPGGTVVDLVSRPGFLEPADDGTGCCGVQSALVFGNTYEFDDAAVASSEDMGIGGEDPIDPFVLFSSGFGNDHALTTLNGEDSLGDWVLYVGDSAAGDNGTFDGFTLEITGETCVCDPASGDVTGDGCVSFADILSILGTWGTADPAGDANCDGIVTFADILLVLGTWGQGCP